jgi:hypothetical protein
MCREMFDLYSIVYLDCVCLCLYYSLSMVRSRCLGIVVDSSVYNRFLPWDGHGILA